MKDKKKEETWSIKCKGVKYIKQGKSQVKVEEKRSGKNLSGHSPRGGLNIISCGGRVGLMVFGQKDGHFVRWWLSRWFPWPG